MVPMKPSIVFLGLLPLAVFAQTNDTLGLGNGFITLNTTNFNAKIVRDSQVLASLKPNGDIFDFLPFDYIGRRARNGQYHWGDVTFRYRVEGETAWIDGDSAAQRHPVASVESPPLQNTLASSNLAPTLPNSPLNITRQWIEVDGDLGLRFIIENAGSSRIELGSLGFPAEFNSIFTDRHAVDMQRLCSLSDPYIGMDAGQIRVGPVSGSGAALVVTALGSTPMEAYRNLQEGGYEGTWYGSQTFEGFYEWQTLSRAWAENEWRNTKPWNPASSRSIDPGETVQFGLRFSVAKEGVRGIDAAVRANGIPIAVGVPGFIVSSGEPAKLFLDSKVEVTSITSDPAGMLQAVQDSPRKYTITPSRTAWGRVRLDVRYADGRIQTVHYYVTKESTQAVADLGRFLTTEQYYTDKSDPFGRAPSVMTFDYEARSIVEQDSRAWVAGLSDEAGAGSYLSAFMKQSIQPNAEEVAKLEAFVDGVLWKSIQRSDYGVKKSIFFYEPALVPGYTYSPSLDWTSWTSWNKAGADDIGRGYNYVHVAAAYWSLYRVARGYPDLTKAHAWDWYLDQAYQTTIRIMKNDVFYSDVGLMGETVFGEILTDLGREGQADKADALSAAMKQRAAHWDTLQVPFGSEMAWDSTGQEGVYYWAKEFGFSNTVAKALDSVLGYTHNIPHWGYNGNSRRYWDNIYGGKLRRIERQIHHYGSGLNALVLLSAFRSNPNDTYLLRTGYGGTTGPLSNINQDGFAAASFHSWPDTLKWDGISGDYGSGFLGLALGSGTYLVEDPELGLVAFGGVLEGTKVRTNDAVRRKVFIGPLNLLISVDAGIIQDFSYATGSQSVSLTVAQLDWVPRAPSAIVWVESPSGSSSFSVKTSGFAQVRGGWQVPLTTESVTVEVGPA
ncbi:hypothetical protein PpBr36_03683 [Pyricularia pennisetigena]|uniref:hypothetical protein n=1 Tax=Pyricularia pennisetigena TaxID=1578925 RepID=UPI00114DC9E2|nr:hypothetical protein PpBr36_03683 [Pyricularia pennisetigena]TLS31603.1 hypothetical protein PpBr36_03683 [Pyricularia pennisetigena]